MGLGGREGAATRWRRRALAGVVVGLAAAMPLAAQISPGELSAPHAELDGSGDCLECHAQRKGVDPALCLECHELLAERIDAGMGLHARAEYEDCASCHIEHHGREFELVWWGEGGEGTFDHGLAGYDLVGAHEKVSCRDCHRAESITAAGELSRRRKDLNRTFLGLDPACLACHRDEHRGQVEADSCLSCHTMEAWMPPALFDHDRTRFALTGRHGDLACGECHAMLEAPGTPGETHLDFGVPAFAQCGDCHRDPHEGRLGGRCSDCHGTLGWRSTDRAGFDHDRTRFRLLGRHRQVECAGCHRPGEPMRVARFERCRDCHDDAHQGQLDDRPDGGACESCHELRGFRPSTFGLEEHQAGRYPLEGSHLAVPCDGCHQRVEPGRLGEILGRAVAAQPAGSVRPIRLDFAATACRDCHADPHRDEVRELVTAGGCETCHSLAGWTDIGFDHERTGYTLSGGHLGPACGECHDSAEAPAGEARIRLAGAPTECAGCHQDSHRGQFAVAGVVACERCHEVVDWTAPLFDHQADSLFPLEGAHQQVECRLCHPVEAADGMPLVRYKPLPTSCVGCHGEPREELVVGAAEQRPPV